MSRLYQSRVECVYGFDLVFSFMLQVAWCSIPSDLWLKTMPEVPSSGHRLRGGVLLTFAVSVWLLLGTVDSSNDVTSQEFYQCGFNYGTASPGVIYPRGDLPVKVKSSGLPDPFYITCHLNPFHDLYKEKGLRSDDLVLERYCRLNLFYQGTSKWSG